MYILSRQEMVDIDTVTIREWGLDARILMEYAGSGSAEIIHELLPDKGEVAIFCGHGNNGGDGFVVARCLKNKGFCPIVFLIGSTDKMSSETAANYKLLTKMKIPVYHISNLEEWEDLTDDYFYDSETTFEAIIDALYGIGFQGKLPDMTALILEKLNDINTLKFAIDIPSGLDTDSGWTEHAFRADITLTMAAPKYGHYLGKGREYCGIVIPIDIGIPLDVWTDKQPAACLVTDDNVIYPERQPYYHKGDYGRVAIIAGSPGFSGAAVLAAEAALHSGSGLITLFHHQGMENIYETNLIEVMTRTLPFSEEDDLIKNNFLADELVELPEIKKFLETLDLFDVLLIGPGLGMTPLSIALVNMITKVWQKPALYDADALNILAHYPHWLKRLEQRPVILTPHIGEFARISQVSNQEVLQDSMTAINKFLSEYDVNLLLKGVTRLFANRSQKVFDISGNDGLATGGSGDVLSGIIVSFLGQKLSPAEAAVSGSYLLGTTAEKCAEFKQTPAITPSDIIDYMFEED
ncbi:MAG: NAD(P)H-hydrate dehydratase [Candidatus Cloacimonetes bacterium]|nr:NAD(P)H-hydrate dehydratase [Candidatus Cloacimonadota bacterium]